MLSTDEALHRLVHQPGVLVDAGLVVVGSELAGGVEGVAIVSHGDVDEGVVGAVYVVLVESHRLQEGIAGVLPP